MDERNERDDRPMPTPDDRALPPDHRVEPGIRQATPLLVQLGRAGRPPGLLAAAIVLFVAIAIVKPWPDTARPPTPVEPRPAIGATATPVPTADPLAELRRHCEQPLGWRVYSIERWADQTLRIWRSLEPAPAAVDATDPRIPAIPLGPAVELAGYCSPWDGAERPPAGSRLMSWSLEAGTGAGRAAPIEVEQIAPRPPNVLGALFGAPATSIRPSPGPAGGSGSAPRQSAIPSPHGEPAASTRPSGSSAHEGDGSGSLASPPSGTDIWPGGHFVFELVAPDWQRWWAIDIPAPVSTQPG